MHSKYDSMHNNEIFYALICINNHVNSCYQGYPRIHINTKSKRYFGKDDLSHNMGRMRLH